MWRIRKDTGVASDSQLLPVEELQDHVDHLPEEQLHADVGTFQKFWSCGRSRASVEDITHILGIVRTAACPPATSERRPNVSPLRLRRSGPTGSR